MEQNVEAVHIMSPDTMASFVVDAKEKQASENMIRRFFAAVKMLYNYLPEDKAVTKERLQSFSAAWVLTRCSAISLPR